MTSQRWGGPISNPKGKIDKNDQRLEMQIPNGVNGLEDRMAVIWQRGVHSGMMTPGQRRCWKGETLEQWTKNDVIVTMMLQRGLCRSPQAPLQGSSTSGLRSDLLNNWIVYKTCQSLLYGKKAIWAVFLYQKGLIAPGSDADIVVWNPNKTRFSV